MLFLPRGCFCRLLEILSLHSPHTASWSVQGCLQGPVLTFPPSCPQEDLPTGVWSLGSFPVWEDSHLTSFLGSFRRITHSQTEPQSVPSMFPSPLVTAGSSSPPLSFRRFTRHDSGQQLQCLSNSRTRVSPSERALGSVHS